MGEGRSWEEGVAQDIIPSVLSRWRGQGLARLSVADLPLSCGVLPPGVSAGCPILSEDVLCPVSGRVEPRGAALAPLGIRVAELGQLWSSARDSLPSPVHV